MMPPATPSSARSMRYFGSVMRSPKDRCSAGEIASEMSFWKILGNALGEERPISAPLAFASPSGRDAAGDDGVERALKATGKQRLEPCVLGRRPVSSS